MNGKSNRRDVIKLLALSGFSLYVPACFSPDEKKPAEPLPKSDTAKVDTVETIEEAVTSNNVVYLTKDDERYEELRPGFNLNVPKHPAVIALCMNTQGVAEAVKYANEKGLKVAVKSGGHSFEAFSSIDDGMQINLSLMKNIELGENGIATVQPACLLKETYDYLLPKGRVIPAGSCGTVGVGGLALGGGYGFFARQHGLTCDNMVKATMVDGKGEIHTAVEGDELMWALRGGGNGNFGIVTEMEFTTHPAPKTFTRHRFKAYKLDKDRAKLLLQKYFEYSAKLPNTCFAAFVLNYKTLTLLITNYGKDNEALTEMLEAFKPLADKVEIGEPRDLAKALRSYYGIDHPIYFKNASAGYYQNYDTIASSIDAVLDVVFRKSGLIYQINTLGGAIDNAEFEKHSCYPHRAEPYLSELQAYWDEGQNAEPLLTGFAEIQNILFDNGIRKQYRNYPNLAFRNWETAYYGAENYLRLQEVKRTYDPNDHFSNGQTIKL